MTRLLSFLVLLLAPLLAMAQTYSPGTDANLCMWFKADALGLTNGAPVSSWSPSGGTVSEPVVQTVSSNQPIFKTAQQNGLPAVLFDGVSSYLTNGNSFPVASQPLTIFLVYKYTGPENNFQNVFIGNIYSKTSWFVGIYESNVAVYAGGSGSAAVRADPNWHMIMFVVNGSNSIYRIDGGTDTPVTGNPGTNGINSLEIGGQAGYAWSLVNGYVGEFLIYNGDQSTNETAIFNYLESRWAIMQLEQNPPFTFNWTDRRPVGMDVLGGRTFSTTNNPRGWFSPGGADITTSNGLAAFRSKLLARAATEVSILTNMNAQGVIFWDIEGDEIQGLIYVGDPTKVSLLAPEMDAVADEFFAKFTSAGLRVGICIRPHTFGAGTNLPAGTNGDVFILTSAPFGQKGYYYTNGWVQVTNVSAPVTAQSYSELLDKVQYANNRWGCSVFYIDSYGGLDQYGPMSVATLTNILQYSPGILLVPECAYQASLGEGTKMFAMSAPFLSPQYTGYFVPTNVQAIYPNAIAVIRIDPPYTNITSLVASIQAGNIMLVNSSGTNTSVNQVRQAYLDAQASAAPPILLTGAAKLPNGAFQFAFTNTPVGTNYITTNITTTITTNWSKWGPPKITGYTTNTTTTLTTNGSANTATVLATTNLLLPLTNWTVLGTVTDNPPGQFQFTDPQATNHPLRFYRVRSP
jgi:hypothetical protein